MADEILKKDANGATVAGAITDDASTNIRMLRVDDATKGLKVMLIGGMGSGTVTQVNTSGSVTGGPITSTGTISLVNDNATPGNSMYYGTNSSGTKGFFSVSAGSGTVTSVSVTSANGFAGTISNPTTTPAITLSTTITGLLKGNGTAISAATVGTDYVTGSSTNTFTNKTFNTAGAGNSFSINGTAITAVTGTGSVVLSASPTFTGKATFASSTGTLTSDTDGATITFDMNASNLHTVTLGGNRTVAFSNTSTGQVFTIILVQDATGSRTVTWPAGIQWSGGVAPTLTTTAAKADAFTFICFGTNTYYGTVAGQNF